MNCDDADGLLLDYVEEALETRERSALDAHLARCALCRERLRDTRRLLGALSEAREHQGEAMAGGAPRSRGGFTVGGATTSSSWQPGSRLGDFEILGEIGRGGMGVVYRARQVSLNRVVALKVLPALSSVDEKAVTRFVREAQAAARLHHTNIVPVYAQSEHDGHFYYAMELIDGESLDRVIRRRRHASPRSRRDKAEFHDGTSQVGNAHPTALVGDAHPTGDLISEDRLNASAALLISLDGSRFRDLAMLICGAAEGLEHAHAGGVLHRDIKPQNLLLGSDGQLHITDFGLARLLDEPGMTLTGEMIGTPAYMSPEQVGFGRRKIDHRTDVFSLGVTMYELLTLERPFDGATREQLVARICTREPRPPRKINPAIPVDLETICLRALEKDPARRYTGAGAMAADLRRFVENRPIHARRVGLIEKSWKFIRRHPAMTTICLLVALMIGGGLVWRDQTMRSRRVRAGELTDRAFGLLAHDDYRKPDEALALLKEAQETGTDSSDRFRAQYGAAMGLAHLRSNPQTSVDILQGALNASRAEIDRRLILYLLAWAERQRTGRLDGDALRWLNEADAISGEKSAEEHFFRGQVLVRHRPEEAIGEFRLAREKRSNYAQAMLHLARALNTKMYHARRHDTFDEQERVLLNACELQSTQAYPCYLLSITYRLSAEIYQHERTDPKRMEEHFERAFHWSQEAQRREPQSPRGFACEAEYWEAMGDLDRAIDARNRGEPQCRSPDDLAELHDYRWRLYFWTGQHQKAMDDLQWLQQFTAPGAGGQGDSRKSWFAGLFPALVQLDSGRPDEAARLVVTAAQAEPNSARAVTSAACLLRLIGRTDEANALLDQSEARDKSQPMHLAIASEAAPLDWGNRLVSLCRGRETLATMKASVGVTEQGDKLLWSAPYFFEGLNQLAARDRAGAIRLLVACEQTFDYADFCYAARVFLGRLERDPLWPTVIRSGP